MCEDFFWQYVDLELLLYLLQEGDVCVLLVYFFCQQDIVGDGCVVFVMFVYFGVVFEEGFWCYLWLYWECGQVGQLFYFEVEVVGLFGMGIGCYYDFLVYELFGLMDEFMVSFYYFIFGCVVWDICFCNMFVYLVMCCDQFVDSLNLRKYFMIQILDNLVVLLSLEFIEENLFWGMSQDFGFCQFYGGQVLGQVLLVVSQMVEDDCYVYFMYGYFLCFGDVSMLVVYQVDWVCDGGSFSICWVIVIQKGQLIFILSSFFQYDEEGFYYQIEMFEVVGLDNLFLELELICQCVEWIFECICDKLLYLKFIEICLVIQYDFYDLQFDELVKYFWFCVDGKLLDVLVLYKYLLVYVLDFGFFIISMQFYVVLVWQKIMQVVSFDYVLWFYCDLCVDEWLFYVIDSFWVGNVCGFVCGSIFNQSGQLVVLLSQEGLICKCEDWV